MDLVRTNGPTNPRHSSWIIFKWQTLPMCNIFYRDYYQKIECKFVVIPIKKFCLSWVGWTITWNCWRLYEEKGTPLHSICQFLDRCSWKKDCFCSNHRLIYAALHSTNGWFDVKQHDASIIEYYSMTVETNTMYLMDMMYFWPHWSKAIIFSIFDRQWNLVYFSAHSLICNLNKIVTRSLLIRITYNNFELY